MKLHPKGYCAQFVSVIVLSTATAVSIPVLAAEGLSIEEIVVTARKREESVQDVPLAMTALKVQLQDSTVRNLADLDGYMPNMQIGENSGRARGTAISIRGVNASEFTDKSHDSPIAVSLDGVFFGTNSGRNVENFDLERIEVLRGPQGTLFGKNTVGGVINVIRTKPTGELGGKVRLTMGEDGQQEIRALLNFPVTETLAAKVFYTDLAYDGYMKNTFLGTDGPEKDYQNFGLTLFWTPSDRFDALLTVERYEDDSDLGAFANYNVAPGQLPAPPAGSLAQDLSGGTLSCAVYGFCRNDPNSITDEYDTNTTNPGQYRNDVISLNMNYQINDNLNIVSVSAWHDTPYEDYENELDGSADEGILIDNDNVYEQFTQEIRLEGTYGKLDFVAGFYYLDTEYDQYWDTHENFWARILPDLVNNTPLAPGFGFVELCLTGGLGNIKCDQGVPFGGPGLGEKFVQKLWQGQETQSTAFFLHADYQLNEKWMLTAGVRYTDEEKDFHGGQAYMTPLSRNHIWNFDVDYDDRAGISHLSNDWQETSIKLGLSYHYSEDIMFFGSYSEAFKSGGFFGRNQNTGDFERNQYEPEFAESYEIGMKGQFFENRVQFNTSVFYNNFEDKQDSNVVLDPTTQTVATVWENIGGIDYTGVDMELQWIVSENLEIFATAGWLDAEYDGFLSHNFVPVDQQATTPKQNVDFLTPKRAPETTFGFGGTYTAQVGPGELALHMKWNFIDDLETSTYNTPGTDADAVDYLNVTASYSWEKWKVSVYGNNLGDEQLEVPQFLVLPFFAWSSVTPGRQYAAEIEYVF
ncbi:MAG: TonB-dependent receptor [Gammaproteobacteria bacterium]|nr:TonB-dependent receptor [Gammaproteobacteria bacterium]